MNTLNSEKEYIKNRAKIYNVVSTLKNKHFNVECGKKCTQPSGMNY
jgi:hypothetical protein